MSKTYSGLSSGIIFTLLFIHAIKIYISDTTLISIIITLLIISAAFLGDLVASVIKKNYGIKDASNIMPGHGGLYDRFDSLYYGYVLVWYIATYFMKKLIQSFMVEQEV